MTHSAQRLNRLVRSLCFQTYLEIGVNEAETFRLIEAASRTGVDPTFRFDAPGLRDSRTLLHEEPSDTYFAQLPQQTKFDVIFIDGLHRFEQVVRDFSNAVLHTHDRSAILIDDTRPSDPLSSLPDQQETNRFRRLLKSESKDWHGDVFKIVFYIHDFWPGLNYRTLSSGGNPQTLVWRDSSFVRKPLFNSLEVISRLTFFDLHNNINILRQVTAEEGLSECEAYLRT